MSELEQIENLPEILAAINKSPEQLANDLADLVKDGKMTVEQAREIYTGVMESNPESLKLSLNLEDPSQKASDTPIYRQFPQSDGPEEFRSQESKASKTKFPSRILIGSAGLSVVALLGFAVWQLGIIPSGDQSTVASPTSTPRAQPTFGPTSAMSTPGPRSTPTKEKAPANNSKIDRTIYSWQADSVKARQCEFALDAKTRSAFRVWEKNNAGGSSINCSEFTLKYLQTR